MNEPSQCVQAVRPAATRLLTGLFLAWLVLGGPAAEAGWFNTRYSPRDSERPRRTRTDYIILHTTEGPAQGAFNKLYQNGEAHFLVDCNGRVYMIIRAEKIAYHAGLSMWNGRQNIDNCSIGIEVVGYHNGSVTDAQCAALRRLLGNLKRAYGVSDSRVLTHSMVAYGGANRWFSRPHRGRKRCGMLFANPALRSKLGLYGQPARDPDVAAGRLTEGDPYLARMLYPGTSVQAQRAKPSGAASSSSRRTKRRHRRAVGRQRRYAA
jgi:N-acetylmuramoyl-L-alanine amidase